MKNIIFAAVIIFNFTVSGKSLFASNVPVEPCSKTYTIEQIKSIADGFVNNNLGLKNPAIADVDGDGNFDLLIFKDGYAEYYRNTGSNEKPFFVPENMHYEKYSTAFFVKESLPYPIFFADKNGDGRPDMFIIKDKIYNKELQRNEYKVLYSENVLGLDNGTLITLILILVVVVLVLAILR